MRATIPAPRSPAYPYPWRGVPRLLALLALLAALALLAVWRARQWLRSYVLEDAWVASCSAYQEFASSNVLRVRVRVRVDELLVWTKNWYDCVRQPCPLQPAAKPPSPLRRRGRPREHCLRLTPLFET